MKISKDVLFGVLLSGLFFSINSEAKNLNLIEENTNSGFAIYRTGQPSSKDMKELCKLGVQEMLVMSGDADKHEIKYAKDCPTLKVIMNVTQDVNVPVTTAFLDYFDAWVQDAQATGKKIAFRCSCGCHRTGRLAAYYQMKYQDITSGEAIKIMNEHGKYMYLYPSLPKQVKALEQYLDGQTCTYAPNCVDGKGGKRSSRYDFKGFDNNWLYNEESELE